MSYEFADRLIEMRRSRGLSQEELANNLGLSRQAISKWERAESAPDIGNLVALADIYDVTLDELVRGVDMTDAASPENDVASDEERSEVVIEEDAIVVEGSDHASIGTDEAPDLTKEASYPPPNANDVVSPSTPNESIPVQHPETAQNRHGKFRNPLYTFPYALLVALIYLILGFVFGLWHPGWVIFLTIPFYYWIASVITNDPEFEARHTRMYAPPDDQPYIRNDSSSS